MGIIVIDGMQLNSKSNLHLYNNINKNIKIFEYIFKAC